MPMRRQRADAPPDIDPELEAMAAEQAGGLRFVPGRMEWLRLEEIEPHPSNANEGDLGALADAVDHVGFVGLVLVQEAANTPTGKYRLIDGENRWTDLQRRGAPAVPCWIVDVDDDTALRILAGWNHVGRLGRDRPDALARLLQDLAGTSAGLAGSTWDGDDLNAVLAEINQPLTFDTPPAPPPPVPKVPVTQPGDLWTLGEHLLLCGDAATTDAYDRVLGDTPAALTLTDPPYANATEYAQHDDTGDELDRLILGFVPNVRGVSERVLLTPGVANLRRYPAPKWTLAWVEPAGVGSGPWGFTCWQPILAYGTDPYLANGLGRHPDTFVGDGEGASSDEHPVAKPLKVWSWLMERGSVKRGDVVLDPFAGSGTTLIVAHRLGRVARLIELDPGYCDVICARFQAEVGALPMRGGEPHDFLSAEA